MQQIKAPQNYTLDRPSLFLAGSIEMGKAIDWQAEVVHLLADVDVLILNPRREHWDASWEEDVKNKKLQEQIQWELEALEKAEHVIFHFLPDTYSPISLLELGLCARKKGVFVCCPDEYWREPNVEMVCQRYNIPFFQNMGEMLLAVRKSLTS